MSKVNHGWIKFYKCPKCENEKTTFVEYKDYIKLKCTKCKYVWERGKKIMNKEEKEYIEHEIVDRLYCLEEKDFDKTKVDDSYIQAVIKAGKENKNLIDKLQKELDNSISKDKICEMIDKRIDHCCTYDEMYTTALEDFKEIIEKGDIE